MINIVLADDHSIVRSGLRKLVEQLENVNVLAECANGLEVIDFIKTNQDVDLIISDLNMPGMNGLELTAALEHAYPEIKLIILSMYDDLNRVSAAFTAGASAYLLKSAEIEELEFAIKIVKKDRKYIGTELIEKLIAVQINNFHQEEISEDLSQYSERELQVLQLISEGLTNAEISDKIFLSKRTIEGHRQSLLQKTQAKNTASLIRHAIKNRIIT